MNSELGRDVEELLERLAHEIPLEPTNSAARFRIQQKVEELLHGHDQRERILQELFGSGPLTALLEDPQITEILVNGHSSIWFEKGGHFYHHADTFLSPFTLSRFVQLLCQEARVRLDLNQPFADGMWRGLRLHLAQSPLVNVTHSICLRRHPQSPWTLARLRELDFLSDQDLQMLRELILKRENLLVVGPTGAGKTSLLSALLAEIPNEERVVIIEDTSEIHPPNPLSTKLLTRIDSQGHLRDFDLSELVRQSLRMRPARLVLGEVRGGEAKDLLLALSTGHTGSFGSIHAATAREAILRLEMLVQMGAPDWSLDTVRQLIRLSLKTFIVVNIIDGQRKLAGIFRITSLEKFGFLLEEWRSMGPAGVAADRS